MWPRCCRAAHGTLFINWEGQPFGYGDTITVTFSEAPEPGSLAMLGTALAGLAVTRRRLLP